MNSIVRMTDCGPLLARDIAPGVVDIHLPLHAADDLAGDVLELVIDLDAPLILLNTRFAAGGLAGQPRLRDTLTLLAELSTPTVIAYGPWWRLAGLAATVDMTWFEEKTAATDEAVILLQQALETRQPVAAIKQ